MTPFKLLFKLLRLFKLLFALEFMFWMFESLSSCSFRLRLLLLFLFKFMLGVLPFVMLFGVLQWLLFGVLVLLLVREERFI